MTQRRYPTVSFLALLGATIAVACSRPATETAAAPDAQTAAAAVEQAAPATPAPPPPPIEKPLEAGSQEARDAYYCSGLLFAAFPTPMEAQTPVDQARIMDAQIDAMALGEDAAQKLIAEGVAVSDQTAAVANAWAEDAAKDFAEGKPKLTVDACKAKAKALPPVE